MKNFDIGDDEIRIIGSRKREDESTLTTQEGGQESFEEPVAEPHTATSRRKPWWLLLGLSLSLILIILFLYLALRPVHEEIEENVPQQEADAAPEPVEESVVTVEEPEATPVTPSTLTLADTIVNDITLRLFTPQACTASLHLGTAILDEPDVLLAAQAADVRSDNGQPAGTFVLNGELLSRSHSKYGFCAIIGNEITLGRQTETPFFERAIEQGGSFFRQYSLVSDGQMVDIPPRGKALRRSLCLLDGNICIIESTDRESYHDFSQALADMGVSEAISLVGGQALLLYRTSDGEAVMEGQTTDTPYPNTNYIIFRKTK